MSSWPSISLSNPFRCSPEEVDDDQSLNPNPDLNTSSPDRLSPRSSSGVKDDLSELSSTIGHHLRGVACLLSPRPNPNSDDSTSVSDENTQSSSQAIHGIKSDLVEIGDSLKSGLSLVTGISRFASNLLQFQSDGDEAEEDEGETVGITEEIVEFVHQISLRPECWIDFPSPLNNDFIMSDIQKEHTSTIEHLVPNLVSLRQNICNHMSERRFWMIYFILLLPRLNETDFKLLISQEIVDAREILLLNLQNKRNTQTKTSDNFEAASTSQLHDNKNTNKEEKRFSSSSPGLNQETNDNALQGKPVIDIHINAKKPSAVEEDFSFSDLEYNDNDDYRGDVSLYVEFNEWVDLNDEDRINEKKFDRLKSQEKDLEGEESSDWFAVDETDL